MTKKIFEIRQNLVFFPRNLKGLQVLKIKKFLNRNPGISRDSKDFLGPCIGLQESNSDVPRSNKLIQYNKKMPFVVLRNNELRPFVQVLAGLE